MNQRISWIRFACGLLFLSTVLLMADRGVFNAKVTPDELLTGSAQVFSVTAEIGAENLYITSVQVYQTSASGQPIANLGRMYDDGTHGDATAADTVFTAALSATPTADEQMHFRVTAAYQGDRNRYLSPVITVAVMTPVPDAVVDSAIAALQTLEGNFYSYLMNTDPTTARQQVLADALNTLGITAAELWGENLCTLHADTLRGVAFLRDPSVPTDQGAGIPTLPANYTSPGNNGLLIFAPGYNDASPQRGIADHAQSRFNNAAWMSFTPEPPNITMDQAASLGIVTQWGAYGTVVIHTHGGFWSLNGQNYVILRSGTDATLLNRILWMFDLASQRIGVSSSGRFVFYPSFVTKHCAPMHNTFFYLGACESLKNDTLWSALRGKGAKVGFGWSESVLRTFNESTFAALIDPMLPTDPNVAPLTAKQAFDGIGNKCDSQTTPACLEMRVASSEWDNFLFYEGGLVNGDFETGDWTGWTHGGDYDHRIVSGARKHGGSFSGALGRWDTAYHGYDPTSEPYGYEWFYQDFVVPHNVTYLKFDFWMETYDTAIWDWFDAYIMNTSGGVLEILASQAGKSGSNYGPYWTTAMQAPVGGAFTSVGGGWYEVTADISAYRGQRIRIYFDQRLDGYGDQQRTYVDDVRLE